MNLRSLILGATALMLLTLIAYIPAIKDGGFIWDDDQYVTNNSLLHIDDGLEKIWMEPKQSPQYYPLVFTTFRIEYALVELDPWLYHLNNVILHALTAILLWRLLARLKVKGAFIAALIFAVHPVHVESVAWITERKNTLSGLFYMLSLHAYLRWTDIKTGITTTRVWYVLALLAFAAALFSKTVTSTLAPVLLLMIWWQRGRFTKADVIPTLPFFALGILGAIMTALTELNHVEAVGLEWELSLSERFLIAGRAICFYAGKIIWPNPLIFSYERWIIDTSVFWQWLFPLSVLALMATLLVLALKKKISRGPITALFFFAGTLFPALGFINVYPMRYSFVADHFQYLASLGIIVPIAVLIATIGPRLVRYGGVGLIVLLLSILSYRQCFIYEGQAALWEDTMAKNPKSWIAYNNYGMLLFRQGQREAAKPYVFRAAELGPHAREVLNNVGLYIAAAGDNEGAIEWFRRALQADPNHTASHANLARSLLTLGHRDEALKEANAALDIARSRHMDYLHGRLIRAQVYVALERYEDALQDLKIFLLRDKGNPIAYTEMARIMLAFEKTAEAEEAYRQALRIDGNFMEAQLGMAQLLYQRKLYEPAARLYSAALRQSVKQNVEAIANQAMNAGFIAIMQRDPLMAAQFAGELCGLAGPKLGARLYETLLQKLEQTRQPGHYNALLDYARRDPGLSSNQALQEFIAKRKPL